MIDQGSPIDIQSEPLSLDELRAACDSPLQYIAILHRYLDGGLTALPVSAQRVFLQLVRETLARGRDRVRITIRALTEKTGLSKETVSHALRQLSSPSVDLVNVVDAVRLIPLDTIKSDGTPTRNGGSKSLRSAVG